MVWLGVHVEAVRLKTDKGDKRLGAITQSTEQVWAGGPALIYLLVNGRFRIDLRQGSVGKARLATKLRTAASYTVRLLVSTQIQMTNDRNAQASASASRAGSSVRAARRSTHS
jgi:hypothetical protein